jgi:putative FmdB family regulatory protein
VFSSADPSRIGVHRCAVGGRIRAATIHSAGGMMFPTQGRFCMIRANLIILCSRGKAAESHPLRVSGGLGGGSMSTFRHFRSVRYKIRDYPTSTYADAAQQRCLTDWSGFCTIDFARDIHCRTGGGTAMPLYSFHCAKCDGDVELLIGFSEKPPCPACGSKRMQRLMSLTAPQGKTKALMKAGRAQAAREGHLSNFGRAERRR